MDLQMLEILFTQAFQNLGDWLITPMEVFTFLGTETFFLLLIPALYWCFSPSLALRVSVALFFSTAINSLVKMVVAGPRPYWISPEVNAHSSETSFGMPSNHAQSAVAFWGTLGFSLRPLWIRLLAVFLMIMIGLSRIYLGVHFPSDVLVGWLIGALILFLILRSAAQIEAWVLRLGLVKQIGLVTLVSILLLLLTVIPALTLQHRALPQAWLDAANGVSPDHPLDPYNMEIGFTLCGVFWGLFAGAAIYRAKFGDLPIRGSIFQKVLRYFVGLAGVLILYIGLGELLPRDPPLLGFLLRILRYLLMGIWMSLLAPRFFLKLRLA